MQIFISHISEEKPLALVMKDWIVSSFPEQIKVFVSSYPGDIPAGTEWLKEISKALKNSDLLIILYSPESTLRPWINFEAGCGWINEIPIMPICHSGLNVSQIGVPISSFQGLEIDSDDFAKIFFEGIAKHAGIPNAPYLATEKYMSKIKTAIDSINYKYSKSAPDKENTKFSKEQIRILKFLRGRKDKGVISTKEIAVRKSLTMKVTTLQHYMKLLVDESYVFVFNENETSCYAISNKGVSYLINNNYDSKY